MSPLPAVASAVNGSSSVSANSLAGTLCSNNISISAYVLWAPATGSKPRCRTTDTPCPGESGASAPVPRRRRQLIVGHDDDENVARIVRSSSKYNYLSFQASGRQFRNQALGHQAYGEVVGEREDFKSGMCDLSAETQH